MTETGEPDQAWENRRAILGSLAPRTEPARAPTTPPRSTRPPKERRALASARAALSRIPPARARAALILVLVVAIAAVPVVLLVRKGASDAPRRAQPANQPPAAPSASVPRVGAGEVVEVEFADDKCPRDAAEYSDAMNMFKSDLSKAWVCTRVDDQDGQHIQIGLGSLDELSQVRAICGYDYLRPDQVDEWNLHRPVVEIDFYYPADSKHDPTKLMCNGTRGWASEQIDPPVLTSQVLAVIKTTSAPPQHDGAQDAESADPTAQHPPSTVAISRMQFIGTGRTSK